MIALGLLAVVGWTAYWLGYGVGRGRKMAAIDRHARLLGSALRHAAADARLEGLNADRAMPVPPVPGPSIEKVTAEHRRLAERAGATYIFGHGESPR